MDEALANVERGLLEAGESTGTFNSYSVGFHSWEVVRMDLHREKAKLLSEVHTL